MGLTSCHFLADLGNGVATIEAKGFAASHAATGVWRVSVMVNDNRLVANVQRRVQTAYTVGSAGLPTRRERARLEARIDRLKALGDQFDHVCLSRFVVGGSATATIGWVGEACVATEV